MQRNLQTLRKLLPNLTETRPDHGWQAYRTQGAGRRAEPDTIYNAIVAKCDGETDP